jgi:hypothetical protein
VPSVNCTTTPTGAVSNWAGIGSVNPTSGDLQSAGVTAQCANGAASYDAYWETYPQPQTEVFSVNAGDAISVKVSYDNTTDAHAGQYLFALTDQTTGQSFSLWEPCAATSCANAYADVMSSAPSTSNDGAIDSILPLADYGVANFEGSRVTNQAGASGSFVSTDWPEFWQYTEQGVTSPTMATPGTLYGYQSFANTWVAAS